MTITVCTCDPDNELGLSTCPFCLVLEIIATSGPFSSESEVVEACHGIRPEYVKRVYADYIREHGE